MRDLWQIITKGTTQERLKLAAFSLLLAGGWAAFYLGGWWAGG